MFDSATQRPQLSRRVIMALQLGPFGLLALGAMAMALPATRHFGKWFFYEENGPVELLTFAFAMIGAFEALRIAWRGRALELDRLTVAFYAAFGVGLFVTGMEEIAWGQWFFHWQTPAAWSAINAQHETTLHNLEGLQGETELFRIAFGVGGLIGLLCWRVPALSRVATPRVLWPLMVLITAHGVIDLALDLAPDSFAEKAFTRTSELVEMYVTLGGWAYAALNTWRLEPSMELAAANAGELAVAEVGVESEARRA